MTSATTADTLRNLAFDNSLQANIITTPGNGKIIIANSAACKLLGYSKKELLTKSRTDIFDTKESSFKTMLKERTAGGRATALVTAIKKTGKSIPCEITSAIFVDEYGIKKAITTITDMRQSILKQKKIDSKKEKIITANIVLAKSEQKESDVKKEKIVAGNIVLAKSKQKEIDIKKDKIVADNIVLAKSEQNEIDVKKEKIVADNIILARSESDTRFEENNKWIKHIGKTSYDVMWDWDVATGQVYVGDSVEEVFGYKLQNNTIDITDLRAKFLTVEGNRVKEKLEKILASRKKNWSDSYMIKRKNGTVAHVISRASIVRDEEGKAIRLIGATQDVSRLQELEKRLEEETTKQEEQTEKFLLVAKLSFDVIWDWNILTNDLFMGDGFEGLFGYTLKNNRGNITDWGNHLHPDDKEAVQQGLLDATASTATHWEHAYQFIRADGSVARVFDRASIIRDTDGKAYRMIGAMQDISRQKELEEKLDIVMASGGKLRTEYNESFKLIFNSSSDVLFDCDLLADEVVISDAYEKEFGYKITNNMKPVKDWIDHIHPEDREAVTQDYLSVLASDSTEWRYDYRFLRADNSVASVVSRTVILRNAGGIAYRMIGSMHDINKQTVLEGRLAQEIKLKEKQIKDATEDAKATERSDIGKELHDNVNQLLAVSKLYVDMAKRGGANSEMYLSRSSEYTMKAIEEIRSLSKGLTTDIIKNLGLCEAIQNIARDTMEVDPVTISCALENFIEESVSNKFKLNIFRIIQEQLSNILKHANATEVIISLSQNKKFITLIVSDDGVGFDTATKRTGIGIDNIISRAVAYNGTADFVSQVGRGCILNAIFPLTDGLSLKN